MLAVGCVGELGQVALVSVAAAVKIKLICNCPGQLQRPLLPERPESSRLRLARAHKAGVAVALRNCRGQAIRRTAVAAMAGSIGAQQPNIIRRHGGSVGVR